MKVSISEGFMIGAVSPYHSNEAQATARVHAEVNGKKLFVEIKANIEQDGKYSVEAAELAGAIRALADYISPAMPTAAPDVIEQKVRALFPEVTADFGGIANYLRRLL